MQRGSATTKGRRKDKLSRYQGTQVGAGIQTKQLRSARPGKILHTSQQPIPGFAPVTDSFVRGHSDSLDYILHVPQSVRLKIINALFRLLEAKGHSFDQEFVPGWDGWKELIGYLLDSVQSYCGNVPIYIVEQYEEDDLDENVTNPKAFWITNVKHHGQLTNDYSVSLFDVAMLGRHDRVLHDLLIGSIAYLIQRKGIIYWGNDDYYSDEMLFENLSSNYIAATYEKERMSAEEIKKRRREVGKISHSYNEGICADYSRKMESVDERILMKVKRRLALVQKTDLYEAKFWRNFLDLVSCKESLYDFTTSNGIQEDYEDTPVSVNYSFRVCWRYDKIFECQTDYVSTCRNEFGIQDVETENIIFSRNGKINWSTTHQISLIEKLSDFFPMLDNFLKHKLKPYERKAKNSVS
jgi:hypothetical protein